MKFHKVKRSRVIISAIILLLFPGVIFCARPHGSRAQKSAPGLDSVLSHMDAAARALKTVSAKLTYTTVTVLVNDRTTQYGELFFKKGKRPEVLVRFIKPNPKEILFKKNRAEIYYPKINQIQEYDLERRRDLLQQFLLLGFGSETAELKQSYRLHYLGEQKLGNETTPVLELTPTEKQVATQLSKVDLWISENSWLPVQQKFFEPSGDYLIAHYSEMKLNRVLSSSIFKLHPKPGTERVKMN